MTAPSNPPSVIHDRYQLTAWLGYGGMGAAYKAHDLTLDREVAVKFLQPQYFSGAEAVNRFLHEARRLARLGLVAH